MCRTALFLFTLTTLSFGARIACSAPTPIKLDVKIVPIGGTSSLPCSGYEGHTIKEGVATANCQNANGEPVDLLRLCAGGVWVTPYAAIGPTKEGYFNVELYCKKNDPPPQTLIASAQ